MTQDDFDWSPVYRSNYKTDLLRWKGWLRKAEGFLSVIKLVTPEVHETWRRSMLWLKDRTLPLPPQEIFGVHLLLAAYALENILKGALVRQYYRRLETDFERTGKLPKLLKSHNLYWLARFLNLAFTLQEEDLLRRLSHAAVWYGRYPVPAQYEVYDGEQYSDGETYNLRTFSENDPEEVDVLILKIRSNLNF
jgi:hypothetical protein